MRLHIFQHVPFEDEGIIGRWAEAQGFILTRTRFFEDEAPPHADDYDWLVVMGGPMGIYDEALYPWLAAEKDAIRAALLADRHILGICLGAQLLTDCAGGRVEKNQEREIGWFPVKRTGRESPLLEGIPDRFDAFHWHGDRFFEPASGRLLALSDGCPAQIIQIGERALGFQFHLESTPERITALMDHCPDDMAPGPFVRTREHIESDMKKCEASNRIMERVLENMFTV